METILHSIHWINVDASMAFNRRELANQTQFTSIKLLLIFSKLKAFACEFCIINWAVCIIKYDISKLFFVS